MSGRVGHDKKKGLHAVQLFNLAFGVAIGIGWIMVMGSWLGAAGPLGALTAFAITGAVMLTVGYSYAMVAIEAPVAGGELVYATRAFGSRFGGWVGWFLALAYVVVLAFELVSFAWIGRELIPEFPSPPQTDGFAIDWPGAAMGCAALLGIIFFNLRGAQAATRLQDWLVFGKIALSLVFVAAGLVFGDARNLAPLWGAHESGSAFRGTLVVLAMAPFFYAGFGVISQAMGEVRSSETIRALPKVMAATILGTALFYMAVILASAMAAPRGVTLAASLPAAAAFAYVAPWLGKAVLVLGVLGLLTILNGLYFAAVRLIQTLAVQSGLPAALAHIDPRTGISIATGLFVAIAAVLLSLTGKGMLNPFLNVASAALSAVMAVVCAVLIRHRWRAGQRIAIAVPLLGAMLTSTMVVMTMTEAVRASALPIAPEWLVITGWVVIGLLFGLARARPRHDPT